MKIHYYQSLANFEVYVLSLLTFQTELYLNPVTVHSHVTINVYLTIIFDVINIFKWGEDDFSPLVAPKCATFAAIFAIKQDSGLGQGKVPRLWETAREHCVPITTKMSALPSIHSVVNE